MYWCSPGAPFVPGISKSVPYSFPQKPTYFSTSGGTWNTSVSTSVGVWSSLSDGSSSFFGRSMHSTFGSSSIKTRCTHGAIRCVTGDLGTRSDRMHNNAEQLAVDRLLLWPRSLPKVDVQHGNRDDDRQRDEHHREQQILAEQRYGERRRRNDFGKQQKKHGQRQQYTYT